MTAQEFEDRITKWARGRPDIEAFIQIGSRAQSSASVDEWSDWDYHILTDNPSLYLGTDWLPEIGSCWNAHQDRTIRGVIKTSAVFENGFEVDFVPISARLMKLVYWAMNRPRWARFYPRPLRRGIEDTRLIVSPGFRVILGGPSWEERLAALQAPWPARSFSSEDLLFHVNGFWRHAVWVFKKVARGEYRAALQWNQLEVWSHIWALLIEEAKLVGSPARPQARQAELWLNALRRSQTNVSIQADRISLAHALLAEIELFQDVSRSVAGGFGLQLPDRAALADWLQKEVRKLVA